MAAVSTLDSRKVEASSSTIGWAVSSAVGCPMCDIHVNYKNSHSGNPFENTRCFSPTIPATNL